MSDVTQPRAGWYLDPQQQELQRYWDGAQWTDRTAPAPQSAQPASAPAVPSAQAAPPEQSPPGGWQSTSTLPAAAQSVAQQPVGQQPVAAEPERPARRIGRGTIAFIFIGAIAIAIGASILITGGLPF